MKNVIVSYHNTRVFCIFIAKVAPDWAPWEINLARDKRSWSTSVYSSGEASRGNDENFSPTWGDKGCFQVSNAKHAWWGVDLEKTYQIINVVISTRSDSG